MNAVIDQDWMLETQTFNAPVSTTIIDSMVAEYRRDKVQIIDISAFMNKASCLHYFDNGKAFTTKSDAIKRLNSHYWSRALALTDVLDYMNADRRNQWHDQIRENQCPDFDESTVKATLKDLLLSRDTFFAERVDGIFRNLSGEHVTNSPMGFRKRMIIAGVATEYYSSYADKKQGYISDLRVVIAKFMGRDAPRYRSASEIIKIARLNHGQWIKLDGGAIRIRVYLKGTAHLEVHPDMAWRLNCVLAQMYPHAIPSEFRKKPEKRPKEFDLIQKPLPFSVVELLAGMCDVYEPTGQLVRDTHRKIENALRFDYAVSKDFSKTQAGNVLESIGGVLIAKGGYYQFDYSPRDVINEIITSGCIPDHVSHQYYQSSENLARDAIEMAEIGDDDLCLEPSAGQGGLADYMPKDRTTCIEISELHCKILEVKGHSVIKADFLKLEPLNTYDRVVCNPPYSDGRWQAHLEHAFKFLNDDGILVAILPASAKGKELIKGASHEISRVYDNEFQGTSASVVIVKVRKAQ